MKSVLRAYGIIRSTTTSLESSGPEAFQVISVIRMVKKTFLSKGMACNWWKIYIALLHLHKEGMDKKRLTSLRYHQKHHNILRIKWPWSFPSDLNHQDNKKTFLNKGMAGNWCNIYIALLHFHQKVMDEKRLTSLRYHLEHHYTLRIKCSWSLPSDLNHQEWKK